MITELQQQYCRAMPQRLFWLAFKKAMTLGSAGLEPELVAIFSDEAGYCIEDILDLVELESGPGSIF